ncbi:MAG: VUT family protein [Thermoprotei archaeon]|nr:MAG: VUT family protein [Thermoprotei archaeon]
MGKEVRTIMNEKDVLILTVFSGIFGASIIFANIAAGIKLINFLGLIVPAGTIAYSVTFPITDIVDEVYGKRRAIYIVWAGLVAELIVLLLIGLDYIQPPLVPEQQKLFERVFSPQIRIVFASIVAYLVSQHHDVWAFWKWREITKGKHLWIRNNASTTVSQLLDTVLFTTIAFYGFVSIGELLNMIISLWLYKVIIAILDTPLVYLGVSLIRKHVMSGKDTLSDYRFKLVTNT